MSTPCDSCTGSNVGQAGGLKYGRSCSSCPVSQISTNDSGAGCIARIGGRLVSNIRSPTSDQQEHALLLKMRRKSRSMHQLLGFIRAAVPSLVPRQQVMSHQQASEPIIRQHERSTRTSTDQSCVHSLAARCANASERRGELEKKQSEPTGRWCNERIWKNRKLSRKRYLCYIHIYGVCLRYSVISFLWFVCISDVPVQSESSGTRGSLSFTPLGSRVQRGGGRNDDQYEREEQAVLPWDLLR